MTVGRLASLMMAGALCFSVPASAAATYRIAEPVTHENLSVFLVHGEDHPGIGEILTLQEAMAKDVLVVHETSNVNELLVENRSSQFDVFIQAGDIVKGGKQDRVLAVDVIVPPNSGKLPIEAFCVESGRWETRGEEHAQKFSSSNERIVSKELKLASGRARSQGEVWKKVAEAQGKLSANVGESVNAEESATSLQLSLEKPKVVASIDGYVKKLAGIVDGQDDVIGFAFSINGKINSADVFALNALFEKLWPKLLRAASTEAIAELDGAPSAKAATVADVDAFMRGVDRQAAEERVVSSRVKLFTRETTEDIVIESRDEQSDATLHRSYVKKQ